jgi:hypothetical protein
MPLEARVGDKRRSIGTAWDSTEMRKNMLSSLASLEASVKAGLFSLVESVRWCFAMEFDSPEDWNEFLDGTGCGGADADREVIVATLAHPQGRIVVTEDDVAQLYVRA